MNGNILFRIAYTLALIWGFCLAFWPNIHLSHEAHFNAIGAAHITPMIEGYAYRPFVYRRLTPEIIGWLEHHTDYRIINWLNDHAAPPGRFHDWLEFRAMPPEHALRASWTVIVMGFFLLTHAVGQYFIARKAFAHHTQRIWIARAAPLLAFAMIPPFHRFFYFYDFTVLGLWTLCLLSLLYRRYILFALLFLASCWNKETTLFMVPLFALVTWRQMPHWLWAISTLALAGIFAAVKLHLNALYANNGGMLMMEHLRGMVQYYTWLDYDPSLLFFLTVCVWFIAYGWAEKPSALKRCLWLIGPLFVAYIAGGFPAEYRVLYELHAFLIPLFAHSLVSAAALKTPGTARAHYA